MKAFYDYILLFFRLDTKEPKIKAIRKRREEITVLFSAGQNSNPINYYRIPQNSVHD